MNEQAEQLITEAGETVVRWLNSTEGFVVEQAPLLAQEIVTFGRINNSIVPACGIVMLMISLGVMWVARKGLWRGEEMDDDLSLACWLIGVVGALAAFFVFCSQLQPFIKAWFAPRLYILEQIQGLL